MPNSQGIQAETICQAGQRGAVTLLFCANAGGKVAEDNIIIILLHQASIRDAAATACNNILIRCRYILIVE